ncbi:hypothetical protein DPMN_064727 [Dreissena polymorpha]|uniref:Uncharacterized protein n=1 Tax=Dreissena polymorpha TaxID=45954 RepID=A0A9D4CDN8_DREPO|nr:hypothetical protein DPMN_064727 [Dreissena polymorpha]
MDTVPFELTKHKYFSNDGSIPEGLGREEAAKGMDPVSGHYPTEKGHLKLRENNRNIVLINHHGKVMLCSIVKRSMRVQSLTEHNVTNIKLKRHEKHLRHHRGLLHNVFDYKKAIYKDSRANASRLGPPRKRNERNSSQ